MDTPLTDSVVQQEDNLAGGPEGGFSASSAMEAPTAPSVSVVENMPLGSVAPEAPLPFVSHVDETATRIAADKAELAGLQLPPGGTGDINPEATERMMKANEEYERKHNQKPPSLAGRLLHVLGDFFS